MYQEFPMVALGNLLKRTERFEDTDSSKEYQFAGTYSFARGIFVGECKFGSSFRLPRVQRIHMGDFVYCKIMAWEGAFGLVPKIAHNCVMSGAFVAYEIDHTLLDSKYLAYYFKIPSVWKSIGSRSTGTNVRRRSLHPQQFEKAFIPLPSLEVQQRIVTRIEELATRIEEARGLRREATQEANTFTDVTRSRIFMEASEKGTVQLNNVAKLERGKFSHRPRNDSRFFSGEHPWIQIAEIESSDKYIRKWTQTLNDAGLAISRKFPKGTLLISIAATIGSVGILDFDCCIPDSIVAVTPKQDTNSEYLYHFLKFLRNHLEQIAPQSAQKNINLEILSVLPIPNLQTSEQRRIVSYLDDLQAKVDTLKQLQAGTQAELDALLPSILDKAFKGELV